MNQKTVWHYVRTMSRLGACLSFSFLLLLSITSQDVFANAGAGAQTGATGNPAAASGPSENGAVNLDLDIVNAAGQDLPNDSISVLEVGDVLTVNAWITNTKDSSLDNPQVSFNLPAGFAYNGDISGGTATTGSGSLMTLQPPTLISLESHLMTFTVTVNGISDGTRVCFDNFSAQAGGASNPITGEPFCLITADVQDVYRVINVCGNNLNEGLMKGNEECDDGDLNPGDSCDDICRTTQPFISIRKEVTASPLSGSSVNRGDTVHLAVWVENPLSRALTNVVLTDQLGDTFEFLSPGILETTLPAVFGDEANTTERPIDASEGVFVVDAANGLLRINVGAIASGESRRYHYTVTVKADAPFIYEAGRDFTDARSRVAVAGGDITGLTGFNLVTDNGTPNGNATVHYVIEDSNFEVDNDRLETGETCSDGDNSPGDGCDASGQREIADLDEAIALCSNDVLDPGETCLGGDQVEGDGCNQHCAREVFYCGNGLKETTPLQTAAELLAIYANRPKSHLCANEQNKIAPMDVNLDGEVTGADTLIITNFLNGVSGDYSGFCMNVDGSVDGATSPVDMLTIITYLNNPDGAVRKTDRVCPLGAVCNEEMCDDGNFVDGDGCNSNCEVEAKIDVRYQGAAPRSGGVAPRGGQIWYSVFLENPLEVPIENVAIVDVIEPGFTFGALRHRVVVPAGVSWENGQITNALGALDGLVTTEGDASVINVGTLFPGERQQYKYYVVANAEGLLEADGVTPIPEAPLGRIENGVDIRGSVGSNANLEVINENDVITYIISDDAGIAFNNGRIEAVPADPARCDNNPGDCLFGEQCDGAAGCTTDAGNEGLLVDRNACGDGTVDPDNGETCDDLNQIDGDGCNAYCQQEFFTCGNELKEVTDSNNCAAGENCSVITCPTDIPGFVCAPEQCDDGNKIEGDGCSNACEVEVASLGIVINSPTLSAASSLQYSGATLSKGSEITYIYNVQNTGEQLVGTIVIPVAIPVVGGAEVGTMGEIQADSNGVTFDYDQTANTITYEGYQLAAGDSARFGFKVQLDPAFVGTIRKEGIADVVFGTSADGVRVPIAPATPTAVVHYVVDDSDIDPTTTPSICGNGRREGAEECDNDTAGCVNCELPFPDIINSCGDGTLDEDNGEQCDNGVKTCIDGTACTEDSECGGAANSCAARSGDGCNSLCQDEVGICGNGSDPLEGVEECDDGNLQPRDGCSATCETETREDLCGDYIVDTFLGETCDDGKHCEDGSICQEDGDCVDASSNPIGDGLCKARSGDGCEGLDAGIDAVGDSLVCRHEEGFDFEILKTSAPVSGASVRIPDGVSLPGDEIDYIIKIRNTHYRDVTNLVLVEPLSTEVDFVNVSATDNGGNPVTHQINGDEVQINGLRDMTAKVWVPDASDGINGGSFDTDEIVVTIRVRVNDTADGEIMSEASELSGQPAGSAQQTLGTSNTVFHYATDDPSAPVCGDGRLQGDETCEHNPPQDPVVGSPGCDADCQLSPNRCGFDGDDSHDPADMNWIDPGETCDDGPSQFPPLPGDGCNEVCQREWLVCGNGVTENTSCPADNPDCVERVCTPGFPGYPDCLSINETCDDGNRNELGSDGKRDGCDANCQVQVATCGDSVWEPALGEQCEDGNTENGDGCSDQCQHEDPGAGDGAIAVELVGHPVSGTVVKGGTQIAYEYIIRNRQYRDLENVVLTDTIDGRLSDTTLGTESLDGNNAFSATIPLLPARINAGETMPAQDPSVRQVTVVVTVNADASEGTPIIQGDDALVVGALPGDPDTNVTGTVSSTVHYVDHDSVRICSNGILEAGETCENIPPQDPAVSGDGCSGSESANTDDHCQLENPELCGNDADDPGEQCDDGNKISGDGCNSTCQFENYCGNGHVGTNLVDIPSSAPAVEQCDLGTGNGEGSGCTDFCQFEEGRVRVLKYADPPSGAVVREGDEITYTIELTNLDGLPYEANADGDPMLTDSLDSNLEFVAGSGTNGIDLKSGSTTEVIVPLTSTSALTSLASGQTETYTFRAKVVAGASLRETGNDATSAGQFTETGGSITDINRFSETVKHYVVPTANNPFECGNGRLEVGEQCDTGDDLGLPLVGGVVANAGCNDSCQFVNPDLFCGDDDLDSGEQCDDGNRISGDSTECNRFCQNEVGFCGNKIPESGEDCDEGDVLDGDGCSATCMNEPSQVTVLLTVVPPSGNLIDDSHELTLTATVTNTGAQTVDVELTNLLSDGRISLESIAVTNGTTDGVDTDFNSLGNGDTRIDDLVSGVANQKEFTIVVSVDDFADPVDPASLGELRTGYDVAATTMHLALPVTDIINNDVSHELVEDATEDCGDGVRQGDEQCDLPSGNGPGTGCTDQCQFDGNLDDCGNDALDLGEQCDDGGRIPGDGCNDFCQKETFICGNARTENVANGDVCPALATCADEQCDDQNGFDGDGCNASCQYEIKKLSITKEARPASGAVIEAALIDINGNLILDPITGDPVREGGDVVYEIEVLNPNYFAVDDLIVRDNIFAFLEGGPALVVTEDGVTISPDVDAAGITFPGNGGDTFGPREVRTYTIASHFIATAIGAKTNHATAGGNSAVASPVQLEKTSNITTHYLVNDDPANFRCGNTRIEQDEQCEHNPAQDPVIGSPGCDVDCRLTSPELCGDGTEGDGETCDDGKHCVDGTSCTDDSQCDGSVGSCRTRSGDGCNQFCQDESGFCGNGFTDTASGEECDDGNLQDGDGCSAICEDESALATLKLEANYASGASVLVGEDIVYTLTFTNTGDQELTNINLDATLATINAEFPTYLNITSINHAGPSSVTYDNQIIEIASVPVGTASDEFEITVETLQKTGEGETLDSILYHVDFSGASANGLPILWELGGTELMKSNAVEHFLIPAGQTVECGNGRVDQTSDLEECDHGAANGAGCSSDCKLLSNDCGNGSTDGAGEQCDTDTIQLIKPHGGDTCSEFCQDERGGCGNGVEEGAEECDDGNLEGMDGCSATCTEEPPSLQVILSAEPASGSVISQPDQGAMVAHKNQVKYILEVTNDGGQILYNVELTNLFDMTNPGGIPRHENVVITGGDGTGTAEIDQIDPGETVIITVMADIVERVNGVPPTGEFKHQVSAVGQTLLQVGTTSDTPLGSSNEIVHYLIEDVPFVCGNGRLEPKPAGGFEECDLGLTNGPGSGCTSDCELENPDQCGDGDDTDPGETCDDGGYCADGSVCTDDATCAGIGNGECTPRSGDGCNRFCQKEAGFCGNGVPEGLEQCDLPSGNGTGTGCSASCAFEILPLEVTLTSDPLSGAVVGRTDDATTTMVAENEILYTLVIRNPNLQAVSNAAVDNLLPLGLDFAGVATGASFNATQVPASDNRHLISFHSINLASKLEAGNTATLTFIARVNDTVAEGANVDSDADDIVTVMHQATAQGAIAGSTPVATLPVANSNTVKHFLVEDLVASCGNGRLEFGEQCDDGFNVDNDGCSATCQLENPGLCGDGSVPPDPGEQCDDGNRIPGDGCNDFCQQEDDICGNRIPEPSSGEQCDDGNLTDVNPYEVYNLPPGQTPDPVNDTPVFTEDNAKDGCDDSCRDQVATCGLEDSPTVPGTQVGIIDYHLGEVCDIEVSTEVCLLPNGEYVPTDCGNYPNGVDYTCKPPATGVGGCVVEEVVCGDGVPPFGPLGDPKGSEECDFGDTLPNDGCSADCEFERGTCGNNVLEWGNTALGYFNTTDPALMYNEQCDDNNTNDGDGCSSTCIIEAGVDDIELLLVAAPLSGTVLEANDLIHYTIRVTNTRPDAIIPAEDLVVNIPLDIPDDTNPDWEQALNFLTADPGVTYLPNVTPGSDPIIQIDIDNLAGNFTSQDYAFVAQVNATRNPAVAQVSLTASAGIDNPACGDPANQSCPASTSARLSFTSNRVIHSIVQGIVDECGNLRLESGEMCDDGKQCSGSGDACRDNGDCPTGEQCAAQSGDGCDDQCQLEAAVSCNPLSDPDCSLPGCGSPSSPGIEPGANCDDDNNKESGDGCNRLCQSEVICGNGNDDGAMEECDDGNTISGDGCSGPGVDADGSFNPSTTHGCQIETPECGNGITEAFGSDTSLHESCDDGKHCADGSSCLIDGDCGAGGSCETRSGDGCDATCKEETVTTGGGGGGSAPVHSAVGICAVAGDGVSQICSRARPEDGTPGWDSYRSCLKADGVAGEPECAVQWAKSQGYTLCGADVNKNGQLDNDQSTNLYESLAEPRMADLVVTSNGGSQALDAANDEPTCAGLIGIPNQCPGPNCPVLCSAGSLDLNAGPTGAPSAAASSVRKRIVRTSGSKEQDNTILKGDEVTYRVDVVLDPVSIPAGSNYKVGSATVRIHDHTIPSASGGIENREGIDTWFNCDAFPESCWTVRPSGLHGVVFERRLSASEIDDLNTGTAIPQIVLEYTMDSTLALTKDVAALDNVAFAVVEYEFYDDVTPGVLQSEGIQASETLISNSGIIIDPCAPTQTGVSGGPNTIDYSATNGQSAKLNVHRPFIQAAGGGDVMLGDSDRITGDAANIDSGQATTRGRIFVPTDSDLTFDDWSDASSDVMDMQDFAEEGATMDEYYQALVRNAHEIDINTSGINGNYSFAGLDVNNIEEDIIYITGNPGQTVTLDADINLHHEPKTVVIEGGVDLEIVQNVELLNHYLAFIVRGGNVIIEANVTSMDGIYIAEPSTPGDAFTGNFIGMFPPGSTDQTNDLQLKVSGMLVGDVSSLLESRTHIGGYDGSGVFQAQPNIKLVNDRRIQDDTPPGLSGAVGSDWAQGR